MNHIGNDSRSSAQFDGASVARAAIRREWIPVPIDPDSKRPSTKWKEPADWIDDPSVVKQVWGPGGTHEGHGVGILTGPSGLNVLDLDTKNDGEGALADLGHKIGETLVRRTPSGGLHAIYRAQAGPIKSSASEIGPGIDTRGQGGMFIWAMPDRAYETVEDFDPADTPDWLYEATGTVSGGLDEFTPKDFATVEAARAYVEPALRALRDAAEGNRNELVRDAALCVGHFGDEFWSLDEAREMVLDAAIDCGAADEDDTPATLRNALRDARAQGTHRLAPVSPSNGSWGLVDLAPVLAGDVEVPSPTVLARSDGEHLLYPGSIHWVFGEPESGKSWVALAACVEQIRAERHVLYLDYENGAVELIARLTQFGLSPDEIGLYFHMLEPETRLGQGEAEQYAAHLQALRPAVVVLDAFTEVADMEGLSPNDAEAVSRVVRLYLKPAERAGAAVVVIDHVVKDTDRRGLWPSGSQHKKSAVSGAAYLVRMRDQFAPGRCGRAELVVAKDRRGKVRAISSDKQAGTFILDSDSDGCTWRIAPGSPRATSTGTTQLPGKAGEVVQHLDRLGAATDVGYRKARTLVEKDVPGFSASNAAFEEAVKHRKEIRRQALSSVDP
ncbi:bifunctional DNA primase/polymerase [Pseudonocardia tropica]|uniref:Bifunctional DNA primase/polymerase n=1 Tax=Pseudonocardia tropica TaxID=681289 RepID=A0ABV1JP85_9PSEU